jgi:GTP-binding protein Era
METDQPIEVVVAEFIREKILRTTNDEIPHGVAIVIDKFDDQGTLLKIYATIVCERSTHKGIIIGHNGDKLKQIGSYAREDMQKFFGTKVYLELWVKVKENWRDNVQSLSNLGYRSEE